MSDQTETVNPAQTKAEVESLKKRVTALEAALVRLTSGMQYAAKTAANEVSATCTQG